MTIAGPSVSLGLQRLLAGVLVVLFIIPIASGVLGALLPAFGLTPTLAPGNGFLTILEDPRFTSAAWLSIKTGLVATLLVLLLSIVTLVSLHNTRLWIWLSASMPPLLAVPHAAIAVGLVFLIAPSGALVRLVSPWATSWARPPDFWLIPDAQGLALILGLVIKETPFLVLAAVAQLPQLNLDASLKMGRSLGYSPARCWSRLILPQLYPRIRLTLLIILAFNLTVVDMALLLGPSNPGTLSVFLLSLVNDPGSRAAASAGAVLLALMVGMSFIAVRAIEMIVSKVARERRRSGARGHGSNVYRFAGQLLATTTVLISIASLLVLVVWSVTRRWRFPDAFPSAWTLDHWMRANEGLFDPALSTITIAFAAAAFAMLAAIAWLELERQGRAPRLDGIWFIPLLVPQVTLLFGWQAMAYWLRADGYWLTVVYTHWLYTLPYVVLILAVAWRDLDPAWSHAAHSLGAGYWRVLFRVRLPLLIRPLYQAMAVALAVSVAQYLPTLLLGGGRHQTLATELVTSFGGVDRRTIAALAVLQSLLPLLAFVLALLVPRWLSERQRQHNILSSHDSTNG